MYFISFLSMFPTFRAVYPICVIVPHRMFFCFLIVTTETTLAPIKEQNLSSEYDLDLEF